MPNNSTRANALPVSAGPDATASPGVACSCVATERASTACPETGGRGFFSARDGHANAEQSLRAVLSTDTIERHDYDEPSPLEQFLAGATIIGLLAGLLLVLSEGWPLTILLGALS